MRYVSRTGRVALGWLSDRINLDPKTHIKYVDTKNELADMLTKGSFTSVEWDHLLRLLNIVSFSMCSCSLSLWNRKQSIMSKRAQESMAKEVMAYARQRLTNVVSRNLLKPKAKLSERFGCSNSPANQELDQSSVLWSARKLVRDSDQDSTTHSQEWQQHDNPFWVAPGNWREEANRKDKVGIPRADLRPSISRESLRELATAV